GLEMLKKWSDAYIAMLFSANLIGIIIMLSIAIFAPDDVQQTLRSAYFIVITIAIFGLVTMYKSVPSDDKTHALQRCSKEQAIVRKLEMKVIPVALIAAILLYFISQNAGLSMLFLGFILMPLGVIGYLDDRNIVLRDAEFTTFIRSLGAVMGGKGITVG